MMEKDAGIELHNTAKYLRGQLQAVPCEGVSDRRAREAHFELFLRARQTALALWCDFFGMQCALTSNSVNGMGTAQKWPDNKEGGAPCFLWCSGSWRYATAGWTEHREEEQLQVHLAGYDQESVLLVHPEDARLRRAVLDPRGGRDHPIDKILKGAFPKNGDHVRLHCLDAAEAPLFTQNDRYLTGVVISPLAAHDSSLIEVASLAGAEKLVVPNTRLELVTAQDSARVSEIFKNGRNQILRQLDIATSKTIAIEVVSGVGKVVDDTTPVSLWALGDQLLIRVWQEKGGFMLETSVSAPEALAAVGMKDSGLTVLSDAEREKLIALVLSRLIVSDGVLAMEVGSESQARDHSELSRGASERQCNIGYIPLHRESHTLEGVAVETMVKLTGLGDLLVRTHTLPPEPKRVEDICARSEDWAPLGFPSLPWLDQRKRASLAQQLTRCVSARDGSVALAIGERVLRPQDFIPASSLRVVLRVGMTLPLAETEFVNGTGSNRGVGVRSTLDGRWLVVVKAVRSDLILSLLRPSRGERSYCDGIGENRNRGAEGSRKYGAERAKSLRRSLSLQATWREWERLGYGPLQWMSHTQKEHLGSLALSWVSFKIKEHQPRAGDESPQAFLQLRPVIARVSRDCDIAAAVGFVDHNKKARRARVEVRDEGCVFRVNVEVDLEVSSQCRRLVRVFGQEAWRETGLGELLWMERPWRQYLAGRLSQQVAIRTAVDCGSEVSGQEVGNEDQSLIIRSDMPVQYWSGTVVIARLGSHASGVFVTITDIGRRVLIEARDFENGPLLALSRASLEVWTAATGIPALKPPRDMEAFPKRLEDNLAELLGAGFRSRTNQLVKERATRDNQPSPSRRWRGTILHISDIEMGDEQIDDDYVGNVESLDDKTQTSSRLSGVTPLDPAVAKQKTLRLEMLTRMIDEYHAKHGRRDDRKGNPDTIQKGQGKPSAGKVVAFSDQGGSKMETSVESNKGVTLPAIGAAPGSEPTPSAVGSDARPLSNQEPPSFEDTPERSISTALPAGYLCKCCGGQGGKGHGRRCKHTFRRCGLCRVEEVRRVLYGTERNRRQGDSEAKRKGHRPAHGKALPVGVGVRGEGDGEQEEEYDWVTDTDDENPEYECDVCGRVIHETADRFHCETCGDYDMCQTCFLSHKALAGHENGHEAGTGVGHVASHDVQRIMGNAAPVPGWSS